MCISAKRQNYEQNKGFGSQKPINTIRYLELKKNPFD